MITKEDKILIKKLMGIKRLGCSAIDSGISFLIRTGTKKNRQFIKKVVRNWFACLVGIGRPRTSRSCVVQPGAVVD